MWDIRYTICAAIAVELVRCETSQVTAAARKLEIALSAILRYLSGKRQYRIESVDDVNRSIRLLAKDTKDGKQVSLVRPMCSTAASYLKVMSPVHKPSGSGMMRLLTKGRQRISY